MNLEALCAYSLLAISQIGHEIWLKSRDLGALQVSEKSAGDVATDIDLWAEQALREKLLALLPGSNFMGEETGGQLSDAPTWIVDPIDGTANFARGYPQWSVSVALAVDGEPVLGIIVDPNRQESFYATRGQGAWLKSRSGVQRLACSSVSEPFKAIVSTVFPKPVSPLMTPYLAEFEKVIRSVGQVRRSGSMALELAYVAAGRADAFWERGMSSWDAAAGIVLMREAGADVVSLDGLPLLSSQMLAAGPVSMLPFLISLLNSNATK
jgi:myo-inositol-1(or 4)-monophosphatase